MLSINFNLPWIMIVAWIASPQHASAGDDHQARFEKEVRPLLVKYCGDCHSGAEPKARMDLLAIESAPSVENAFDTLRAAMQAMRNAAHAAIRRSEAHRA